MRKYWGKTEKYVFIILIVCGKKNFPNLNPITPLNGIQYHFCSLSYIPLNFIPISLDFYFLLSHTRIKLLSTNDSGDFR